MPDTCSGPISPDTIYPCTTPSSTGTDTFTLTLSGSTELLLIRALPANDISGGALLVTLTAPDGTAVTCQEPIQLYECATSQSGSYTLAVSNQSNTYTLDYTALPEGNCSAIDPSFAAPTITGSDAAGATGTCYSLNMPAGHVLHANTATTPNAITVAVYDATGSPVCVDDEGDCTLTGTAPYQVFVSSFYGEAENYQLQLNDITQPAGCGAAAQETYGQVPATGTGRCRTLTVTKADTYQVAPVGTDFSVPSSTLYTTAGTPACTNFGPYCQLAVGTYNLVVDEFDPVTAFGVEFIAADASKGCTATGDTDFATGPATGRFSGPGEEICLNLPTPSGQSDYFFDQPSALGATPAGVQVVDATGAQQCTSAFSFRYATCALSGTGPFRVILSPLVPDSAYQFLVQRTGFTTGCAVWPQSGFGGSYGATVTLTASNYVKCLTIPAGRHSSGEMIDYSNAANVVDGTVYVNDPSGNQVCMGASLSLCSYKPHVTYTALAILGASNGDTYHLVRRDVSATANCATPASTTVGGPSTTFNLTSDLDTRCYRVTAAATDKLWFSVRTVAPAPAGAVLLVTDASGTIVCRQFGTACQVTGGTDYQVVVDAEGYSGTAITTHLDTWLVGTAAGWAPQCLQNQFSAANGWGPLSGTLTENAAGYCAVVNVEPQQSFGIYGTDTAAYPNSVAVNMYTAAAWASPFGYGGLGGLCIQNNYGYFGFACSSQAATQAVLLVTPGSSPTPVGYIMQAVCQSTCASPPQTATITSVTPSSQPAGPGNVIVVTGTGLNLGTQFQLASSGSSFTQIASPQSVNAAGTQLTLVLDTTDVPPGTYDVVLDNVGYTAGTPSPGYLPGAYTVTAAT